MLTLGTAYSKDYSLFTKHPEISVGEQMGE